MKKKEFSVGKRLTSYKYKAGTIKYYKRKLSRYKRRKSKEALRKFIYQNFEGVEGYIRSLERLSSAWDIF